MDIKKKNFFLFFIFLNLFFGIQSIFAKEVPLVSQVVNIPKIGDVNLIGKVDLVKLTYNLTAKLEEKKHTLKLGPLTIDQGEVALSSENGFQISGRATIFDKSAKLSLKKFKGIWVPIESKKKLKKFVITHATIGLEFIDKPTIEITPQEKIEISNLDLILQPKKEITLETKILLFSQEANLTISQKDNKNLISFSLNELSLNDLAPNDNLKNIKLLNTKFEIQNFIKSQDTKKEGPLVLLEGNADFSSLKTETIKQNLSNIFMKASINKIKGLHLEAILENITLPIGLIENTKLMLDVKPPAQEWDETEASLSLGGNMNLNIPRLGEFQLSLDSKFKKGKFEFSAEIGKLIDFHGISINNARITYLQEKKSFMISGDSEIYDFGIITNLTIKKEKDKTTSIKFDGSLKSEKIKPFAKTNIKGIKDITIKEVKVGLDASKKQKEFYFYGSSHILKMDLEVEFRFKQIENNSGIALKAYLKPDWKFSDSIPKLKNTIFEDFKISNAMLIASTTTYKDKSLNNIEIKPGLTFLGGFDLGGYLEKIDENAKNLISKDIPNIIIYGTIGPELKDLLLAASIPGVLKFPENSPLNSAGLTLEINAKPVSISLLTDLNLKKTKNNPELTFKTRVRIEPTKAEFSGSMMGTWHNVFGIKKFDLSDLALSFNCIYAALAAGVPFSEFAFTGTSKLRNIIIDLAFKLGVDPSNLIIKGAVEQLTLKDLADLANSMIPQGKIPLNDLPDAGIEKVMIYFSPKGGKIGEFNFEPGTAIEGTIIILKKKGHVFASLNKKGLIAEGSISDFNISIPINGKNVRIFTITGLGPDQIDNTEDDGPAISIHFTPTKQVFYLTGKVYALGAYSDTNVSISKKGISFEFEGKAFNLFNARIKGVSSPLFKLNPDFELVVEFIEGKNNFRTYIDNAATNALQQFGKSVSAGIKKAKKEVTDTENAIEKIKQKIKIQEQEIKNLQLQLALNSTRKNDELLLAWNIEKFFKRMRKNIKDVAEDLSTTVVREVDYLTELNPEKRVIKKQIAEKTALILILHRQKEALVSARNIALAVLNNLQKGIERTGGIANFFAKQAASGLTPAQIIVVKEVKFEGSLKNIAKSEMPQLQIKGTILGKNFNLNMQWDFDNLSRSINMFVEALMKSIKKI